MSKKEEIRLRRAKEKQRQRIIVISAVSVFAVIVAALLIVPNLPKPVGEILTPEPVTRTQIQDDTVGDPNAPVKVEEFSDYQCPFCGIFAQQYEPQLLTDYVNTGKVQLKYIAYSFIGPESVAAAEATYCAMDQGKFWEYHDIVFANQKGENQGAYSDARLLAFGESIGLDMKTFKSCVNKRTYQQKILDNLEYGRGLNVNSTPSFIVNGKLVTASDLFTTIDAELAASQ